MGATETASLNTKLPVEEKRLFMETVEALGMTPSAAVRVFVRKFNDCQGFPFPVMRSYPMSLEERLEIAQLDKAIDEGSARIYSSFSEILAEIDDEIANEQQVIHA